MVDKSDGFGRTVRCGRAGRYVDIYGCKLKCRWTLFDHMLPPTDLLHDVDGEGDTFEGLEPWSCTENGLGRAE